MTSHGVERNSSSARNGDARRAGIAARRSGDATATEGRRQAVLRARRLRVAKRHGQGVGRVDPFGGVVKDGRVYGRGTCDMKGGLAAAVIAAETLLEAGVALPGAIEISATVDEESGGYGGVAYLAERGWFSRPRSTT